MILHLGLAHWGGTPKALNCFSAEGLKGLQKKRTLNIERPTSNIEWKR